MREATIGGISALDASQPRANAARRKPAGPRGRQSFWARVRRMRSRLALIVGSAGFSAIMIGIVLNATMLQKGHHPAPLFSTATHAPAVQPAPAVIAPAPLPPVSLPASPPPVPAPALVEPARPLPPASHAPAHAVPAGRAAKPVDGIARFLAGGSPPSARPAPKAATAPARPTPGKPLHPRPAAAVKTPPKTAAQ